MKLVKVEYMDDEGRKFLVQVPEGHEDSPESGILIGPPSVEPLDLPLEYEVKLNNQLYDRNLYTLADVRQRPEEIRAALMAVLRLDTLGIRSLYGR